MTVGTSEAAIITGTTATVSSQYAGFEFSSDLVDAADLNVSNEHLSSVFGGGTNWLSVDGAVGTAAVQWVYIDLGTEYDLEEVRIWNYNSSSTGAGDVSGRGVNAFELFVGATGATLPAVASGTAFSAAGWSSVTSGNLVQGPSSDPGPGPYALDAGNTIGLSNTGVRYVGIQIGSRQTGDPYTADAVGLAQIQVTSIPEPTTFALFGLSAVGLILRRRR